MILDNYTFRIVIDYKFKLNNYIYKLLLIIPVFYYKIYIYN